jgi:hypothetical protein
VTIGAGDPLVRLWRVDWDDLSTALRAATRACLSPGDRVAHLDESDAAARVAWERCERRNGRAP